MRILDDLVNVDNWKYGEEYGPYGSFSVLNWVGEDIDIERAIDELEELDNASKENAALRSLLSDAMKALESTQEDLNKFKEVCGDNDLIVPMWVNNQIENLAILAARIKATLTGGE